MISPILIFSILMTTPDGCKVFVEQYADKGKSYQEHLVTNPNECSDKELVKYLNCTNTMLPKNKQPKECQ